jgi:Ca2+-binding EF-hand superfamily protein
MSNEPERDSNKMLILGLLNSGGFFMVFRAIAFVFLISAISFSIQAGEKGFEKRFTMMDRNGDGKLTKDEFRKPEMFEKLDKNKDGSVTLEEAKEIMVERPSFNFEERFKMLDTNNDGKLSGEEFKKPELFDRMDLNKDGFITLEELDKNRGGSKTRPELD